ncbi:MAG: uroporphyrinogen decarboxylase family protein [Candidatus Latescibacteria bacterium]|jgi:uroporphyrinogen-III decarboxylase|nr:uroporphyrinogen decarboxylase family protein [Candidatus Latescibacterota bacterium]
MTSHDRILRAMRGEPVDRVANSPRIWKWNIQYYGAHSPENSLRAAEEFDFDPIYDTSAGVPNFMGASIPSADILPPDVTCTGEIEEGEAYNTVHRRFVTPAGPLTDIWCRPHPGKGYGISPTPSHFEYLLKEPSDLKRLRFLKGSPSPKAIERFQGLVDMYGEKGLISPYVRSPFNDLSYVYPVVDTLMLPYDDPEFLLGILAFFQESCLDDIVAHLEAGAETIFMSGFHISLSVGWSPALFREYFLPLIVEQAQVTHDGGAVFRYYDDGKTMDILEMMIEADVDTFCTCTPHPAGDFELQAARERVRDRMTLMGYVDIENVLHRGSPELVDATVREAIEVLAVNDRFLLSSSDGILTQTPIENLRAYFTAAKKYGLRVS